MNLIDELRMLAEDLYVNGYTRYSAAMSKAADELAKWEAVFGHLGGTPDEMIERMRDVEVALHEIVWSNDSKWQSDRARSVLEKSK
jgi:hypothetical protein